MRLLGYSGKQRNSKLFYIRRVLGASMLPFVRPGNIIIGLGRYRKLELSDVVIVRHQGIEKVKRITKIRPGVVYIEGDNSQQSTDSRTFGWIDQSTIVAKVLWPRTRRH